MQASLVLITDTSGVLCGIYQDSCLIESKKYSLKTLDALISMWMEIGQDYKIDAIFYARGPGSLSALKLLHIFVHTLHIVSGIKIFAVDGFYFNQGKPIKAFGKQYFIKTPQGEMILNQLPQADEANFSLPSVIKKEDFNQIVQPLYIVPPV